MTKRVRSKLFSQYEFDGSDDLDGNRAKHRELQSNL